MSFLRATRTLVQATRRYSTAAPGSSGKSGLGPLWLAGAGVVGLGAWYSMGGLGPMPKKKQEKSPLNPEKFLDFKLKEVRPYNHNTSTFVFELPNNEASLLPVASCLVVKSSNPEALQDDKGKPIIRPYTPISQPDDEGKLVLLVKKYDNGNASKYIHTLKPGDSLSFKGPIPKFPWKQNEFEQVALLGGGSGITPLWQILSHALPDPSNKTKFTLIFGNDTEKDILMREEFDALKKKYPATFDVIHVLAKPDEGWKGAKGFITGEMLKEYVAPASLGDKVKVFVCGPPPQVNALAGAKAGMKQGELGGVLKELGYSENQVFKF